MDLWIIVIALLVIAVALMIWSFYKQDNGEKVQEEFEELSLQWLQEINHLKKRVLSLESELNIQSEELPLSDKVHDVLRKHVVTLYTQGIAIEEISSQTRLSEKTIKAVIDDYVLEA